MQVLAVGLVLLLLLLLLTSLLGGALLRRHRQARARLTAAEVALFIHGDPGAMDPQAVRLVVGCGSVW